MTFSPSTSPWSGDTDKLVNRMAAPLATEVATGTSVAGVLGIPTASAAPTSAKARAARPHRARRRPWAVHSGGPTCLIRGTLPKAVAATCLGGRDGN